MEKHTEAKSTGSEKAASSYRNIRDLMSIPLEVDLENGQLFFIEGIKQKLNFDLNTGNIDKVIKTYVDPKDLKKVKHSLSQAKKGIEKPIPFNFIHPLTAQSLRFEYRYQIEYVKYSSTRLRGVLVSIRGSKTSVNDPEASGKKA
jgi:hypothetical protein